MLVRATHKKLFAGSGFHALSFFPFYFVLLFYLFEMFKLPK
jgi:hypothetical protein